MVSAMMGVGLCAVPLMEVVFPEVVGYRDIEPETQRSARSPALIPSG